jgi:hypothetical protein
MKLHSFRQDSQDHQDLLDLILLYPVHPVDPVRKWKFMLLSFFIHLDRPLFRLAAVLTPDT